MDDIQSFCALCRLTIQQLYINHQRHEPFIVATTACSQPYRNQRAEYCHAEKVGRNPKILQLLGLRLKYSAD
jgi:hypothetical protein